MMAEGVPVSTFGGYTSAATTVQNGSSIKLIYAELSIDEDTGRTGIIWPGNDLSPVTATVVTTPLNSGVSKNVYSVSPNHCCLAAILTVCVQAIIGPTKDMSVFKRFFNVGTGQHVNPKENYDSCACDVNRILLGTWFLSGFYRECKARGINEVDTGKSTSLHPRKIKFDRPTLQIFASRTSSSSRRLSLKKSPSSLQLPVSLQRI